jgi:hypothetical protein
MFGFDCLEGTFIVWAFLFQIVLIVHFALRKWRFGIVVRYGSWVYALGIPAAMLSVFLLLGGKTWFLWLGGFLYLAWGIYGFWVDYVKKIQWRVPPHWPVLIPYVSLYLATIMFYWWPVGLLSRPLWFAYAVLFAISTALNLTSHKPSKQG